LQGINADDFGRAPRDFGKDILDWDSPLNKAGLPRLSGFN